MNRALPLAIVRVWQSTSAVRTRYDAHTSIGAGESRNGGVVSSLPSSVMESCYEQKTRIIGMRWCDEVVATVHIIGKLVTVVVSSEPLTTVLPCCLRMVRRVYPILHLQVRSYASRWTCCPSALMSLAFHTCYTACRRCVASHGCVPPRKLPREGAPSDVESILGQREGVCRTHWCKPAETTCAELCQVVSPGLPGRTFRHGPHAP